MALSKLTLRPSKLDYAVTFGRNSQAVKMDGGASYQSARLARPDKVAATWILDRWGFNDFVVFFETTLLNGSLAFLIDLVIDSTSLEEYTARFADGAYTLRSKIGDTYTVSANLLVYPRYDDYEMYGAVAASYEGSFEYGSNLLARLATLVNTDLPENMP